MADAPSNRFRESEVRAQILASTARLGHGLIDIYLLTIARLRSLELRRLESDEDDAANLESAANYGISREARGPEGLPRCPAAVGRHSTNCARLLRTFGLVLDVNEPDARTRPLGEVARLFGNLYGATAARRGNVREVSKKLVRQFRMPGYPLVLVTTDLLQEGEDLHTFCSSIHHYGISWTPSSMEQRIGRIDRVRSQTDRRLSNLLREPRGRRAPSGTLSASSGYR